MKGHGSHDLIIGDWSFIVQISKGHSSHDLIIGDWSFVVQILKGHGSQGQKSGSEIWVIYSEALCCIKILKGHGSHDLIIGDWSFIVQILKGHGSHDLMTGHFYNRRRHLPGKVKYYKSILHRHIDRQTN